MCTATVTASQVSNLGNTAQMAADYTFNFTTGTAPAITSANTTTFSVGQAGTFTVMTTGGPVPALSATGVLPTGVNFVDNGDGTATLSGTPAAGSNPSYPITLTASNGIAPNATQNFTLVVNAGPAITSANNATFTVGTAGTFTVTTTGNPASAACVVPGTASRTAGFILGRRRWMTSVSSISLTGLFICVQFRKAMSRNVSVETSPVRMTTGVP